MGEDIFGEWYAYSLTEIVYRPSNYPGPIAVDATIEPTPSVSLMEWINVKDRLPKLYEKILIHYDGVELGRYSMEYGKPEFEYLNLTGEVFWTPCNDVKFWMPLPKPPKD